MLYNFFSRCQPNKEQSVLLLTSDDDIVVVTTCTSSNNTTPDWIVTAARTEQTVRFYPTLAKPIAARARKTCLHYS